MRKKTGSVGPLGNWGDGALPDGSLIIFIQSVRLVLPDLPLINGRLSRFFCQILWFLNVGKYYLFFQAHSMWSKKVLYILKSWFQPTMFLPPLEAKKNHHYEI